MSLLPSWFSVALRGSGLGCGLGCRNTENIECLVPRAHFCRFVSNVSAGVLISADLCRMSQLPSWFSVALRGSGLGCSRWSQSWFSVALVSNVSAGVLISADLCRMSQLPSWFSVRGPGSGLAILLYLSVSLISASEMSKIAKTFNDYWTKVLQNLGFRGVRKLR